MQTVLIAGAGRSSSWVIDYMLRNAKQKWNVIVMDANEELIHEKLSNHRNGRAAVVDIHDKKERQRYVEQADIVLSLMPSHLHILLAEDCLKFGKNLITSSYATKEMYAMDEAVKKAGLLFMCEMGLDPGIDHMSAAKIIQGVQRIAGDITSFKTVCGGLVAAESDDNPWQYKICWNPNKIVTAGKDGATWMEAGKIKKITYDEVFEHPKKITIDNVGLLAAYPNRDSLAYKDLYQLNEAKTIIRSTLRHPEYIKAWKYLVHAGLTNDTDNLDSREMTYSGWVAQKSGLKDDDKLIQNFKEKYNVDARSIKMLEWLRIFEPRLINGAKDVSSSIILQHLLEHRWKMRPTDKDLVVMQHQVEYERRGLASKLTSTMIVKGEDRMYSAMAKTVGLPMGILAKRILNKEIRIDRITGVHIPIMPEVFTPVLKALRRHGIEFIEEME